MEGQFRCHFSPSQKRRLEEVFQREHYISKQTKAELASELGLTKLQITSWFQRRRTILRAEKRREKSEENQQSTRPSPCRVAQSSTSNPEPDKMHEDDLKSSSKEVKEAFDHSNQASSSSFIASLPEQASTKLEGSQTTDVNQSKTTINEPHGDRNAEN
ncbi:uncharacterized protein LOC143460349 [Clavelina lepadiformis]|uniref:uncharacterized protein LOC143460349 n=1 Tax=Clavelina lepadiformis TaxID=159417 RepID=UPI004040EE28